MINHVRRFLVLLLLSLGFAHSAPAQPDPSAGFSAGGDVGLKISLIGVGGRARPGDWTAFQVQVYDRASNAKPRRLIVRIEIPDDDGDLGLRQCSISSTPGKATTVWLYARLPFTFDTSSEIRAAAFLPLDPDSGENSLAAYDASKPIGTLSRRVDGLINRSSSLIGVVGRKSAGLDQYADRATSTTDAPIAGHELTEIVSGILPEEMPDLVHGLRSFEAIVWTGAGIKEDPAALKVSQADAIREWVASGGHLIVILPVVGQGWLDTPHQLSDIMPLVHPKRIDSTSTEPFRQLLTRSPKATLPDSNTLYTFTADPSAGPQDAMPILIAPDGSPIAMRRLIGVGAVTVIGLDITNLASLPGVVRADTFWHRILGKRHEILSRQEVTDLIDTRKVSQSAYSRSPELFDSSIPGLINREGKATGMILIAVVVFGAFWLIAGPVGFFALKQRRKTQHSWVAYVAAIALFTAISWTAAMAMRQGSADARHVTIVDHVYGQNIQRARVWANVFLPSYGSASVSAPTQPIEIAKRPLKPNPAVSEWDEPGAEGGALEFPDSRSFLVDGRNPSAISFPARATTRAVQVDWLGVIKWGMPLPQSATPEPDPSTIGGQLKFVTSQPQGLKDRWAMTGTLTHQLPAALHNVVIIVNRGQTSIRPTSRGGILPADAGVFRLNKDWKPGDTLDLALETANAESASRADLYLADLCPPSSSHVTVPTGRVVKEDRFRTASEDIKNLVRLSLFSMLQPPDIYDANDSRCLARRSTTHTLDLSRWFTQPCVIIMGFLPDSECPVPLQVNNEPIPTKGLTMVRWVFPLPPAPPAIIPPTSTNDSAPSPSDAPDKK